MEGAASGCVAGRACAHFRSTQDCLRIPDGRGNKRFKYVLRSADGQGEPDSLRCGREKRGAQPFPPNFGLSRQFRHRPQSSRQHESHRPHATARFRFFSSHQSSLCRRPSPKLGWSLKALTKTASGVLSFSIPERRTPAVIPPGSQTWPRERRRKITSDGRTDGQFQYLLHNGSRLVLSVGYIIPRQFLSSEVHLDFGFWSFVWLFGIWTGVRNN